MRETRNVLDSPGLAVGWHFLDVVHQRTSRAIGVVALAKGSIGARQGRHSKGRHAEGSHE